MKNLFIAALIFLNILTSGFAKIRNVYVIHAKGIINPVMASYIVENIKKYDSKENLIILTLDTPGGLLESMREIVLTILNSKTIIAGYVYPPGARAASAGAFIILSTHYAFMAPSTHIGAAHPVSLGQKLDETTKEKIVNDTVAFMINIAERRKRNQKVCIQMVKKSISLSEREALKKDVIDGVANNLNEIVYSLSKKIAIEKSPSIHHVKMNFIERFLYTISHPQIAYILLILGIYGILAEFSTPGIGFPGVVGSISLILAFFGLNTLPVNTAGLLLIILSLILFILEVKIQSGGIIGIGGVISLILGSLILFKSSSPLFKVPISLIISVSIFSIIFLGIMFFLVVKVHKRRVTTGKEGIIGTEGVAISDIKPRGQVLVEGEIWQAMCEKGKNIKAGTPIVVKNIKNLLLIVEKKKD